MDKGIFGFKQIKLFIIEDLVNFIMGMILVLFPIYIKFIGIFYAIFLPIAIIHCFKGILIIIDLIRKNYVCEELELFGLYPREFDCLRSKNYYEVELLLKNGKKLELKSTLKIDIQLRSRVKVCYLKRSKILYSICSI